MSSPRSDKDSITLIFGLKHKLKRLWNKNITDCCGDCLMDGGKDVLFMGENCVNG